MKLRYLYRRIDVYRLTYKPHRAPTGGFCSQISRITTG
jgi:hypothetical protein